MRFFLGTCEPAWLKRTDVPLFISRRRLARRKSLPRALGPWALDSGGFTEISRYGEWRTCPRQYVAEVDRWRAEVGNLQWAAIQDWMCEPTMLAKTRMTVGQHQQLTVNSWLYLTSIASWLPWIPVLQGWSVGDYVAHVELYHRHTTTRLDRLPLVGLGSVCRRQSTEEVVEIARELTGMGIKLHGFGVKIAGLRNGLSNLLRSSDSMAWSYRGRRIGGKNHCMEFATQWRDKVLRSIESGRRRFQPSLW